VTEEDVLTASERWVRKVASRTDTSWVIGHSIITVAWLLVALWETANPTRSWHVTINWVLFAGFLLQTFHAWERVGVARLLKRHAEELRRLKDAKAAA
jgi:hypothetical protein